MLAAIDLTLDDDATEEDSVSRTSEWPLSPQELASKYFHNLDHKLVVVSSVSLASMYNWLHNWCAYPPVAFTSKLGDFERAFKSCMDDLTKKIEQECQ